MQIEDDKRWICKRSTRRANNAASIDALRATRPFLPHGLSRITKCNIEHFALDLVELFHSTLTTRKVDTPMNT
jgi:hypothetical protein